MIRGWSENVLNCGMFIVRSSGLIGTRTVASYTMYLIFTNAYCAVWRGLIRYSTCMRCAEGLGWGYLFVSEFLRQWSVKHCVCSLTNEHFAWGKSIYHVDWGRLDDFLD